jgi:hypothetical protein
MDARSFIAVVLAGSELTSRTIVHPTLWKLDHHAQVRAEKLIYRRFASIDPFLMTFTVIACLVAAGGLAGHDETLALIAGICFAGMLAITLIANMPIDLRRPALGRAARRPRRMAAPTPTMGPDTHPPRRARQRRVHPHHTRRPR